MFDNAKVWAKKQYHHILGINDTPHRKALGLGLGVFLGNFPSMGPVTALIAAFIFRANRATALLGSVLTNTWLSLITLGFSIRVAALLPGSDEQKLKADWNEFIHDLHLNNVWLKLKQGSMLKLVGSVFFGYFVVSLVIGVAVYFLTFFILMSRKQKLKVRS